MSSKKKKGLIRYAWGTSFSIMRHYPKIFIPLGLSMFLQLVALTVLFLSHSHPFSVILAPPISRFWGEVYLHYPFNLLILPKLFNFANIMIGILFGAFMTGITAAMVWQVMTMGIRPRIRSNFRKSIKRYFTLVSVWILLFVLETAVFKGPKVLIMKYYHIYGSTIFNKGNILIAVLVISILLAIIVETLFVYAVPAAVIENRRIGAAIKRSFWALKGMFFPTFFLVLTPTLFSIGIVLLKSRIPQLIARFDNPEIALYIIVFGIIVNWLVNCLVAVSVASLFVKKVKDL